MKNAGSFCLVKLKILSLKTLCLSGFPLVKAYYFPTIFLVLKMKIKKKKREFFFRKNLELRGDNCENSGELVTNDHIGRSENIASFY